MSHVMIRHPRRRTLVDLDDDDFIPLSDMAASEGVKESTAYRWILQCGYRSFCRKKLIKHRMRLVVPLKIAEAYAAARGPYPVAKKRPPGWVGVKEAAARLAISPQGVHYRAQKGQIPAVRVGRRAYFNVQVPSDRARPGRPP